MHNEDRIFQAMERTYGFVTKLGVVEGYK